MKPAWLASHPTREDATAILNLLIACDISEYGEADSSLEDLYKAWDGLDLTTDAWIILTPRQELIGYATVHMSSNDEATSDIYTHPAFTGQGIGTYLRREVEAWTYHQSKEAGNRAITLTQTISGVNDEARHLIERAGYAPMRHFYRMAIDLHTAPSQAVLPRGITLQQFVPETDDRAVFEVIAEAFAEAWQKNPPTFTMWHDYTIDRSDFDPTLWWIAKAEGSAVGAILSYPFSGRGWIRQLGVRTGWRRQGIGRALLLQSFNTFYQWGVRKVALGINAQNRTGATELYTQVGMVIERQYDTYGKTIQANGPNMQAS